MANLQDRIKSFRRVKASKLIPNKRNYRTHPQEQQNAVSGVLAEIGIADALIAREDDNGDLILIDGHLRQGLDPDQKWPVMILDVSEEEADLLLATLDPLSAMAGTDAGLLEDLLGDMGEFESGDINELLATLAKDAGIEGPEITEDEIPDLPDEPITKPGDLWLLGDHRLLCGDTTKPEDMARLMDGQRADLWNTDPPYNVSYEGGSKPRETTQNDNLQDSAFRTFLRKSFEAAFEALKPGASFYIWHADTEGFNFRGAVRDCDQQIRQCLIWNKNNSMFSRQDYHWKHEPCLYGWKAGAAHGWYTDRKQTTVLEFDRPMRSKEHPTMKPVALIAYQIGN